MKTRNLLLWALACGIAIMLAGAVFLFQLVTQDELAEPIPVGTAVAVGDVTATVLGSRESGGELVVDVTLELADDAPAGTDATSGFHLIASGRAVEPTAVACPDACTVSFDVSGADGTSRVLFYERGDAQERWVLG